MTRNTAVRSVAWIATAAAAYSAPLENTMFPIYGFITPFIAGAHIATVTPGQHIAQGRCTASPSITNDESSGFTSAASTISGYRPLQSWPLRVNKRTRLSSRWTIKAVAVLLDLVDPFRPVGHLRRLGRDAGFEC